MKRKNGESLIQYAGRATDALSEGLIDYNEWAEAVVGDGDMYARENLRRCSVFFNQFVQNVRNDVIEGHDEDVDELRDATDALIKERKKIETANLEHQEYFRKVARQELLTEQIEEAIGKLPKIQPVHMDYTYPAETTGLLIISDEHFDSTFEIKGLYGETVNKYDKDVFKTRMWHLLAMMENDRFDYDQLFVVSAGDAVENILRMSSLQKLRHGVIDSTIEFAEFMSQWLVEANKRLGVPIRFAIISGNHDVSRVLTQTPEFPEESLAKIIHAFMDLRLADVYGVNVEPYGDVFFTNLYGSNLLFAHGETGDLVSLMDYYENLYDIEIDCLYAGHLHRSETKSAGVGAVGDREVIRVPSICGTDTYAKKILKNSRAGAYFALYSELGRELNKIYYLN